MRELAFLTPYFAGARGNVTTTLRLKQAYERQGYRVNVIPYLEPNAKALYLEAIRENQFMHILHITRFSSWLEQHELPLPQKYILTMGGTDIYADIKHKGIDNSTYTLLQQSRAICFFTAGARKLLNERLRETNLPLSQEVVQKVIPQGIVLPPLTEAGQQRITGNIAKFLDKQALHLLLPSGLRGIKDIFFLKQAWEQLAMKFQDFSVTVIGEALEENVRHEVEHYAKDHAFFRYLPAKPFEVMGEVFARATIVLNTSIEEGQPTAICEAMGYGLLVMVRHNDGNSYFVQHGQNGLIFRSTEEFLEQVNELLASPELVNRLRRGAKEALQRLSPNEEIKEYISLIED